MKSALQLSGLALAWSRSLRAQNSSAPPFQHSGAMRVGLSTPNCLMVERAAFINRRVVNERVMRLAVQALQKHI